MRVIRQIVALTAGRRVAYALAILTLALSTVLFLFIPSALGTLVQRASLPTAATDYATLFGPAISIASILIGQAVLTAIYGYTVAIQSERIGNSLRHNFFQNLLARPFALMDDRQMGVIASEFASDIGLIQAAVGDALISFLRHCVVTVGALIAMFLVDTGMAAITLASTGAVAAVLSLFVRFATRAIIKVQEQRSSVLALLLEASSNRYVIQAFGRSSFFEKRFDERLSSAFAQITKHLRLTTIMNPVALVIFAAAIFVILAYGLHGVATDRLQLADLVAFTGYAMLLVAAMSQIGIVSGQLRQAGALVDKHRELLATPQERAAAPYGMRAPSATNNPPAFRFDSVTYSYPGSARPALKGASFAIPAGVTTAIVGASGAGKSTIAALLIGLIRPDSGLINQTGGDVTEPCALAIVPQHPFLFAGSVAENIAFGRDDVDRVAIELAARRAQLHDHIVKLPDGYDHLINEAGSNFSRGQQQRLALARALAGSPKALLLDEATASIDVVSERAIRYALRDLGAGMTKIVIAHQGELLKDVDHLVYLVDGRVAFSGAPNDADKAHELLTLLPQLREGVVER